MTNGHENLERIIRNTGNFILRSSARAARATGRYVSNTAIPALGRGVRSVARGTAREFGRRAGGYIMTTLGIGLFCTGLYMNKEATKYKDTGAVYAGIVFALGGAVTAGVGLRRLSDSYESDSRR